MSANNMNNQSSQTLEMWAGSNRPTLALLFTDIVDSTAIGKKLGDNKWIDELANHFAKGRQLALKHDGYVIKVIGDAFMIAFRNATNAVDFAIEFSLDTGVPFVGIRVGIHSGQVRIVDNDIYGLNVNMAARIQTSVAREGISVSEPIKRDYTQVVGVNDDLRFRPSVSDLKNFGKVTLWSPVSRDMILARKHVAVERNKIVPVQQSIAPSAKPPVGSQTHSPGASFTPAPHGNNDLIEAIKRATDAKLNPLFKK